MPADKLTVTVYHTDDEAFGLWKKIAGLPDEPHHPHRDQGQFLVDGRHRPVRAVLARSSTIMATISRAARPGSPDEDGDRFVEIWNLVFMQYRAGRRGDDRLRAAASRASIPAWGWSASPPCCRASTTTMTPTPSRR